MSFWSKSLLACLLLSGLILVSGFILLGEASALRTKPVCGIRDDDGTPVNRCISLELMSDPNTISSQLTVMATVTDNGMPVSGEEVRIEVASGPNVGQFVEGGLNLRGQIALSYGGARGPGLDTIRACIIDFVEPGPCVETTFAAQK